MKIKFDQLFDNTWEKASIILLFGNDESVIERGKSFVIHRLRQSPCTLSFVDEATFLKGDHGQEAPDLFGDPTLKSVMCVENVGERTLKLMGDLSPETRYVFTSPKIRASSPTLKALETKPFFAGIACYSTPLVWGEFLEAVPHLPEPFQKPLFRALQHHPHLLHNVAQKMDLLGDQITKEDLQDFLPSLTENTQDRALMEGFISRDPRLFVQGELTDSIPFIRSLQRALTQLLQLTSLVRSGTSQKEAFQKAGIFFKDEPLFLSGLKKWTFKEITNHLRLLHTLEHDVKFKNLTETQVKEECLLLF